MKKTLLTKTFLLLFAAASFSGSLYATAYYVSPTGSDSNDGLTPGSAWKTIDMINSLDILPGDSILFEGGQTFTGGIEIDSTDANDSTNIVLFSSYGTGRATINSANGAGFYAYNVGGFTISDLNFAGSGMGTNTEDGVGVYADAENLYKYANITFKNLEISGYGKCGLNIGSYNTNNIGYRNVLIDSLHVHDVKENGIVVWGYWDEFNIGWSHENVTLRNTQVHNVPGYAASGHRGSGVILAQIDGGVMEHCVAHDNGSGNTSCGGPGGLWAWDCNNITIQYNESYLNSSGSGCDGLGFDFDGGMTNSLMQYNYSHDNDGAGILLGQFDYSRDWYNNTVRYNISENDARTNGSAIELFKGPTSTMWGATIYNNTVYISPSANNLTASAFGMVEWDEFIDSTEVYNNIFQTTGGVPLVDMPENYHAYFAGNLYWSTGDDFTINYDGSTYNDLDGWRTATGNEEVSALPAGMTADPLLTTPGTGIIVYPSDPEQLTAYRLPANSPAINAGLNLQSEFGIDAGSRDLFGNATPVSLPDIGAYESSIVTALLQNIAHNTTVTAFPNPVQAGSDIRIVADHVFSTAELFNVTGTCISKAESIYADTYILPTANIAKGIYLIRVSDKSGFQKNIPLVIQ